MTDKGNESDFSMTKEDSEKIERQARELMCAVDTSPDGQQFKSMTGMEKAIRGNVVLFKHAKSLLADLEGFHAWRVIGFLVSLNNAWPHFSLDQVLDIVEEIHPRVFKKYRKYQSTT